MGIEKVLALSTAHMPETDPDFWNQGADGEQGAVPRLMPFEYGFVLWVTEEFDNLAEWLQPIMRYARYTECTLVMFDKDIDPGDFEHMFKTYDW